MSPGRGGDRLTVRPNCEFLAVSILEWVMATSVNTEVAPTGDRLDPLEEITEGRNTSAP